jgi:hypothetical protein
MINKDMMVLQNCTNLEKVVPGPCGETCPTSHDGNHTMNIKIEEVSDAEGGQASLPTAFVKIKAEPAEEVSDVDWEQAVIPIPFQKMKAEPVEEISDTEAEEAPMPIPFQRIKAEPAEEEGSVAEVEKVPVTTPFVKVKTEPEVSCDVSVMSIVRQVSQICRSAICISYLHLSDLTHERAPLC